MGKCTRLYVLLTMRIVQINANYGFGSTGLIAKDLQVICQQNGIDCEVVYSNSKGIVTCGYQIGNYFSNKLHAILSRISGKQGYFSVFTTIRLLYHLNKFKVDAIHLHNLHSGYINLPLLLKYASKKKIPIIVTLHDCWFYTGGCTHYTSAGCKKWLNNCGNCPQRYKEFPSYLLDGSSSILKSRKELFGNIKKLTAVGVSHWITEEASKNIFKNAMCITIHNGIDTTFFHPTKTDIIYNLGLNGKFIILAPSNKWFLDINDDTFKYFASKLTDDMCMVFIGNGFDERRVTDRMINYGFVSSREEIRDVYSAADVMINCTREESLSLLNLEVQSCGTPVVTYSNTGVKETVNGKCSFAVADGVPEALWDAMMMIKSNGKKTYSKQCIEWVKSNFDKEMNYKKYIELYRNTLEK